MYFEMFLCALVLWVHASLIRSHDVTVPPWPWHQMLLEWCVHREVDHTHTQCIFGGFWCSLQISGTKCKRDILGECETDGSRGMSQVTMPNL